MKYKALLVIATVIWGSSFVIMKDVTGYLSPSWLLAFRFTVAAAILAVAFLGKRKLYFGKSHVIRGVVIGLSLFVAYYTQTVGLTDTTPGKNAFLTGTYCVMVPFLTWLVMHKKPTSFNVMAAALCIAGIGLISLDAGLSIGFGDAMTLVGAVFYAVQIVLMAKLSPKHDVSVLTMWQFITVAVCNLVIGFATEPVPHLSELPASALPSLLYLAVIVTAVALLFQNIGLAHVPPASASLLLSLESVFGAALSVALGAEALTARLALGFVVVFAAVVVSEYLPERLGSGGKAKRAS